MNNEETEKFKELRDKYDLSVRVHNYQQDLKNIDWRVVEQGLTDDELIIAIGQANGNYTLIAFCPTLKKFERRIVFQWDPIVVDYCRGCKEFHF